MPPSISRSIIGRVAPVCEKNSAQMMMPVVTAESAIKTSASVRPVAVVELLLHPHSSIGLPRPVVAPHSSASASRMTISRSAVSTLATGDRGVGRLTFLMPFVPVFPRGAGSLLDFHVRSSRFHSVFCTKYRVISACQFAETEPFVCRSSAAFEAVCSR